MQTCQNQFKFILVFWFHSSTSANSTPPYIGICGFGHSCLFESQTYLITTRFLFESTQPPPKSHVFLSSLELWYISSTISCLYKVVFPDLSHYISCISETVLFWNSFQYFFRFLLCFCISGFVPKVANIVSQWVCGCECRGARVFACIKMTPCSARSLPFLLSH